MKIDVNWPLLDYPVTLSGVYERGDDSTGIDASFATNEAYLELPGRRIYFKVQEELFEEFDQLGLEAIELRIRDEGFNDD